MRRKRWATGFGLAGLMAALMAPAAPGMVVDPPASRGPALRVLVEVVNDDGGTAGPDDAVIHVRSNGVEVQNSPAPGKAAGDWYHHLAAGAYQVSVSAPRGYTATFSKDCGPNGTVIVRHDADRCRITLDDDPPVLHVRTSVVNDDGGTLLPAAFTARVLSAGADVPGSPWAGDPDGVAYILAAGRYDVVAAAVDRYSASVGGACAPDGAVTLAAGDDLTCTVVLDDEPAVLDVVTTVVNDDGGTATPAAFGVRVLSGATDVGGSPAPGDPTGTAFRLPAGPYAVAASAPGRYAVTVAGACAADGAVLLTMGDWRTCTVTFNDKPASLRVVARLIDSTGRSVALEDFDLRVLLAGLGLEASPVDGDAAGRRYRLATGRYLLASDLLPGYGVEVGGDCSADGAIELELGDEGTCTVTFFALPRTGAPPEELPPELTTEPLPPPPLGKAVNLRRSSGKVRYKLPGAKKFVSLTEGAQIPVGTEVDTREGRVTLESAANAQGATSSGRFYSGMFKVGQSAGASPLTTLRLSQKLSCPRGRRATASATRKRRLWGDGSGRFRTQGKYSSATVRGTKWLVEDSCASTVTRVARGSVTVRDSARRKTVIVRAGKRYVARPLR